MAENRAKIAAAAQATETVVTKWNEAQNALTTWPHLEDYE